MNRQIVRWSLLLVFLIAVGLWPAAATPITLAATGAGEILAAVPGSVWLAVAVIAWLKYRPTPTKPATA